MIDSDGSIRVKADLTAAPATFQVKLYHFYLTP